MICDRNFTHFVAVSPADFMKKVKSFFGFLWDNKKSKKKKDKKRDIQDKSVFHFDKMFGDIGNKSANELFLTINYYLIPGPKTTKQ